MIESLGFNASLPWAIFDELGTLQLLNARMEKLLDKKVTGPLTSVEMQKLWPFQNEHQSSMAHYRHFVLMPFHEAPMRSTLAIARLKNFRIFIKELHVPASAKILFTPRIVVAEMLRSGDLLTDEGSRQELFRSLSHEIRTSVMALKGYMGMLTDSAESSPMKEVVKRLNPTLERLDHVVERLQDFKVEMEVLPESKASSPKTAPVKAPAAKTSSAKGKK